MPGRPRNPLYGEFVPGGPNPVVCNPEAWRLMAKAASVFGSNPLNLLNRKHILVFARSFSRLNSQIWSDAW